MENKTITMPLSEYERLTKIDKELEEMIKMNIELKDAKAIFIDRRNSLNSTYQTRIYGKGVELNKAIKELRREVDEMYIEHLGYKEKWEEAVEDYRKKGHPLAEKLGSITSKWWYKLFNYGK